MHTVATLAAGLLFGLGLVVSGLINPAKVLNFLDIGGAWDASLAFTMGAAVLTTAVGYKIAFRGKPILADGFHLPAATDIDGRLITGAALFGVGWGLVGYCPGPAVASLSLGSASTAVFVAAMLAGMGIARMLARTPATRSSRVLASIPTFRGGTP